MNTLRYIRSYSLILMLMALAFASKGQIVLDTGLQTASSPIGSFGTLTINVPTEALTGDNIALNITLPGMVPASCVKTVTVTHSDNLIFQTYGTEPFSNVGLYTQQNDGVLVGNDGMSFNLYYKFPGYVTCNGAAGTFEVTLTIECGGQEYTATASVQVIARAANYWTVTKEFIGGNLVCGMSKWLIGVEHNNPNGSGLGTYSIQGTLTENAPVEIVSGAFFNVGPAQMAHNSRIVYFTYLRNCVPENGIITNEVQYQLQLGDGCETMEGSVSESSPAMSSPNASVSFKKEVYKATSTNLSPGCQGRYRILLENNGNVPWTNITVTDDLNIPGITVVGNPSIPNGWTMNNSNGVYTFEGGTNVLEPGELAQIIIPFAIDGSVAVGTEITNTAVVTYQAEGAETQNPGGGGTSDACPDVDCPELDYSIQNDSTSAKFIVEEPRPIPSITKCLINPPTGISPPLYTMDDQIHFAVNIWNSGAGNLSEILSDDLTAYGQNLQIDPASIQYEYYTDAHTNDINSCTPASGILQSSIPFPITANTTDLQHPTFTISGMPGSCEVQKGNFLRITFKANILPQMYGSKTNEAALTFNNSYRISRVNYSIDQKGHLGIEKRADRETVENGQSFNYILSVINKGTVPLHTIKVMDDLPSCVVLDGDIVARNMAGNIIPSTHSANIEIHLDATAEIMPGETFTITVPVRKTQIGTCCNVDAYATAVITTSGILLDASDGSEEAPAACVTSVECCDIPGFTAEMVKRDGKYYIQISGGNVPIQELDVTMLDFHVSYNQEDCKPADMGVFGQLTSTTTQLGGLLLQDDVPSGSLTWGLGQPTIVNGQLEIEVSSPDILDISCCELTFSFCLKVRAKDVNCNVCEKTICYDGETEEGPCDMVITEMSEGRTFCAGEVINLSWTGSTTSGFVDVYLVDAQTNTVYQVLATGVSGINTISFTVPEDFPCDDNRVLYFQIVDPKGECVVESRRFQINCCVQACDCGFWKSRDVSVKHILTAVPNEQFENSISLLRKASAINLTQQVSCGESIRLSIGSYSFTAPEFVCQPADCAVIYQWEISGPNGLLQTGTSKTFAYQLTQYGNYNITFTPICGGVKCEPCTIRVSVPRIGVGGIDLEADSNVSFGR